MSLKKLEKSLSTEDKKIISEMFEPLLSGKFGGEKYKKYFLQDMQQTTRNLLMGSLKTKTKHKQISSTASKYVIETIITIMNSTTTEKVLQIISEAALLSINMSEDGV